MVVRIFRHYVPVSVVLLAASDIVLIFLAMHFYFLGQSIDPADLRGVMHSPSLHLAVLIGIGMAISGHYHSKVFLDHKFMVLQIGLSFILLCPILLFAESYWRGDTGLDLTDSLWEKAAFGWLVCILFTRAVFLTLVDLNAFKRPVLVLGTGERAERIGALDRVGGYPHFHPVAYRDTRHGVDADIEGERTAPNAIAQQARQLGAKEIVIAADDRRGLPMEALLECRVSGIKVIDYLDFMERETKSIDLAALNPGWLLFSDGFRASRLARAGKRCFDLVLSLSLLLFTLPLMLLTCVLIVLDDPGPVLYRQERVGRAGRRFVLLKFRSMRVDAERDGAPRWAAAADPRVTRVGRVIRKLRIDELPQLLNVLRGEMSFVGPRPERPGFVAEFTGKIPFYAHRHCVKPGITGWAQINYPYGASLEDARTKLAYDLYYVKNQGLFLDIIIALQTVRVILWADGAR